MEASQGRSPVHRAVCPWIGCVDKFYPPAPVEVADKRNFAAAERAAAIEPHNHDALGFHLPFYGARDRVSTWCADGSQAAEDLSSRPWLNVPAASPCLSFVACRLLPVGFTSSRPCAQCLRVVAGTSHGRMKFQGRDGFDAKGAVRANGGAGCLLCSLSHCGRPCAASRRQASECIQGYARFKIANYPWPP